MSDLGKLLDAANARLKAAKAGVAISTANTSSRLYLRATLPPKPGSPKNRPYQQKIALGVYFNTAGIKRAESEAKRLSADLALGQFKWEDWESGKTTSTQQKSGDSVEELCAKFKAHYYSTHHSPSINTSYRTSYQTAFNKLPNDAQLTPELLLDVILKSKAATRTRERDVDAFTALAQFAGIEVDFRQYRAGYNVKALNYRDVPSDDLILEYYFELLQFSQPWANVYALMATYGLRNHEVFLVDFKRLQEPPGVCHVLRGKTGYRMTWPYRPDWWQLFKLDQPLQMPNIKFDPENANHCELGQTVCSFWGSWKKSNYRLPPFKPYDLRHAWAVRTAVAGLDPLIAARMMGHSVEIHSRTYLNFISEASFQAAWEKTIQR